MTIHWISRSFKELDLDLFHEVLRLRTDVFVVEQRCAYAELDGQDPRHCTLWEGSRTDRSWPTHGSFHLRRMATCTLAGWSSDRTIGARGWDAKR